MNECGLLSVCYSVVNVAAAAGMDGDARNRRRSSKHKAPPPPVLKGHALSAYPHVTMDQKENLLEQDLTLTVILPGGVEKTTVVHGSKPMMDLLVTLCGKYHLNPSGHTIELITTNRNHVKFRPNALIGALEAEKILIKPKGLEDRSRKTGPQMPEATVRLVINYKKTQKTILRVSPRVPVRELLPAICEKCEFDPQSTVLLRNVHSEDTLDLNCSLNDLGLREVYARDTRVFIPVSPVSLPPSPIRSDTIRHRKDKIQKENKGLFGLFRKGSRKLSEHSVTVSAPASPVQRRQRPVSMSSFRTHSPTYDSNTMPSDMPKKRRAPLPPSMMSQSMPTDLTEPTQPAWHPDGEQNVAPLSAGPLTESCLRRTSTKRKAPPPPTLTSRAPPDETAQDRSVTEPVLASPLEEIREQEEVTVPRDQLQELEDDSSLNLSADISLDSATQDSEMESVSPHGTSRDYTLRDLSTETGIPETAVNGEVQSEQVTSRDVQSEQTLNCHIQSEMEPLKETIGKSTQSSESDLVLEKVSVSSSFNMPQTLDCGVQTSLSNTNSQTQCLDSNTAVPQTLPKPFSEPCRSAVSEDQIQKTNPSRVIFTQTEIQTQTDSTTVSNVPTSSFSTERSVDRLTSAAGLKRDMATSTEEICVPEAQTTTIQSSKIPASTPTAAKAANVQYVTDPKPKPSNELTRDYIPKVGMTTYTIVPQKSLEKLRFFEVELTLERRADDGVENRDSQTFLPPSGHLPPLTNGTAALNSGQRLSGIPPASPRDDVFSPSSPSEEAEPCAKEKKVPPAIRPKPASFRLPLHKRAPGDYVTSAAVRRASVGSTSSGSSTCSSPAARPQSDIFPPSPQPVRLEEEENRTGPSDLPHPENTEDDGSKPKHSAKDIETPRFPPSSCLTRQKSLPVNPTPSLSLEKLRSFAAPKPYSPSSPSRFAQAVLSAAKRSQSLTQRPLSPPEPTVTNNEEDDTETYRAAPSRTAGHGSTRHTDMGTCRIGNTQPSPVSEGSSTSSPTLKGILETSVEE